MACANGEAGELNGRKKSSARGDARSGPSIADRTTHAKGYARTLGRRGAISAAGFGTDGIERAPVRLVDWVRPPRSDSVGTRSEPDEQCQFEFEIEPNFEDLIGVANQLQKL